MGIRFSSGFTIIEVSLFLAITGALFAALMIGVGNNITQQRYRESVVDFAAYLQNQYSEASNVRNIREGEERCQGGAINPNLSQPRGTSSCVILGRAIQINGSSITSSSILGVETDEYDTNNDIQAILDFGPKISEFAESDYQLTWQSSLKTATSNRTNPSILIIRSPASGLMRVFAWESPLPDELNQMIEETTTATNTLEICVIGDTGSLPEESVSINPRISGADGVTINGENSRCA